MRVLGLMSGTSLDAVDLAVLVTDGEKVIDLGPAGERKLPRGLRSLCLDATHSAQTWLPGSPQPEIFRRAAYAVAVFQADAVNAFMAEHRLDQRSFAAVGFHGQTVVHAAPEGGRSGHSVQLGDAEILARRIGISVVSDLRAADIAAGGHGAPLAPVYHAALAEMTILPRPLAVLNIGGVANLTLINEAGELAAFDVGPGNGPIDQWVEQHGRGAYDRGGRLASAGTPDETCIRALLSHPFFQLPGPKSLDRYAFTSELASGMALEDGAATLAAFCAAAVAAALVQAEPITQLVVCGGGRRNAAIMSELSRRIHAPVLTAEQVGWNGDAIEAQAWAFLAARSLRKLPLTYPGTTGVNRPVTGGRLVAANTGQAFPHSPPVIAPTCRDSSVEAVTVLRPRGKKTQSTSTDPAKSKRSALEGAVIAFDLDGTLVDTAPDLIGALNEVLQAEHLPPVPSSSVRHLVGHGARALLKQGFVLAERNWQSEREEALIGHFLDCYVGRIARESRPYPETEAALDGLSRAGAKLVVCTNKRTDLSVALLESLSLARWFEAVIGGDLAPSPKPDPRHLLLAIGAVGGAPEHAVMVGDSEADIGAARAAGVPSIAVEFGYCSGLVHSLGADVVIGDYAQLAPTVEQLLQRSSVWA